MYAHVITITGWTWEYIDWNMDIPRLGVLSKYWKQHPALHQMVQSFMGIETEQDQAAVPADSVDDLPAFIAAFNNAGGTIN